jgi:hypothetical protein
MARYFPNSKETVFGHLAKQRQNVWLTKPKDPKALPPTVLPTTPPSSADEPSNQVFIKVYPLSKLYTDDTGRFPVRA